jgi:hypothetical protein
MQFLEKYRLEILLSILYGSIIITLLKVIFS